jgi:chromosome segregation protein
MTKINKLVAHGFKSFADKTELVFGDTFNCVLGPNGSGKCLVGESEVQLADGRIVPIRELVEEKEQKNSKRKIDDGWIISGDATEILCMNTKTARIESRPIQAYVRREAPKTLLTIITRSGRKVTATPYHPLFILRDNKIVSARADELNEGTRIAVPRKISVAPKTKIFYELLDEIYAEDGIYVPWSEQLERLLVSRKRGFWKGIAQTAGVPDFVIKGFMDKQSINFAYIVRLLRFLHYSDDQIIQAIPSIKAKTSSKRYHMLWENSTEFARLLGYLLAEGRLAESPSQVWFTNGTEELVEDYAQLVNSVFKERVTVNEYKAGCWDVLVYSEPIKLLLSKFGMPLHGGTGQKTISPVFFAHSGEEEFAELLNGLYCGDGYVSKNSIEITTKSEMLSSAIQTILTRLGIIYQTQEVVKVATNSGFSGRYQCVRIYGVEHFNTFASYVRLKHHLKQARLMELLGKSANPNVDLIEVNGLIKKVSQQLGINIKKTKNQFSKLDAYCYNQCTPSRPGIQQLLRELFVPQAVQPTQELILLQQLAHSDVYWDEIVSIEEKKSDEEWVYDLCVSEHHNFIANNLFVHNSNILDAICFVLGRLGSKSLRAEKSANLVFNGGKKKKAADKGEVHIYFDNKNKVFPADGDEVKVSRVIKKSGQSVYKINGKTRTRNEVVDLLSAARIDPDGYNIILQGDIMRFIEMSSVERRQVVEEISGVSIYEERKHKALLEMNKVEDKLQEAEIVLSERKAHLRELKKDRDQALKFKDFQSRIESNKATFLRIQLDKKEAIANKLEKEIDMMKDKLNKSELNIEGYKKNILQKKEAAKNVNSEIEQKGEVEQVELNKEIENLRVLLEKQRNRVEMIKDAMAKSKVRKEALDKEIKDIDNSINDLSGKKSTLEKRQAEKDSELRLIEKKIDIFKKKNKIDGLGNIEQEIEAIDKLIEKKQEEIHTVRGKQQELLREKDRVEYNINNLDERVKKVGEVARAHKKQVADLKDKKTRFVRLTKDLNSALDADGEAAGKIGSCRKELHELYERKVALEGRHVAAQERAGGNIAVKNILGLKKSGVYGTIAKLGQVGKKYSLALEIAAGQRVNSIVVENDKIAADCIKHLKDKKLGIASFIPLNKVKTKGGSSHYLKEKGVHGLAIELVDFDAKFLKAFQYVFGDTIVCDNLTVVRRIGVGDARMVTLEGDIADRSGVMRGGHYTKRAGVFVENDAAKEISSVDKKVKDLRVLIEDLHSRKETNESGISIMRKEKMQLEGEIARLEKTLHLAGEDLDATEQQKSDLVKQMSDVNVQLMSIQDQVDLINKDLAETKSKKEKLKVEINQLRNPRLLAELQAFEEARRNVRDVVMEIKNDIIAIERQVVSMMQPEQQRILELVKGHSKEEELFSAELKELQSKISGGLKDLKTKDASMRAFMSAYKGLYNKRDKIADQINSLEQLAEKVRGHSRKIEIEMNNVSLKHASVKSELAGLEIQFEPVRNGKILRGKNEDELKSEIGKFERLLATMSAVNMKALEIYEQVEVEFKKLIEKRETLMAEKGDVVGLMDEIEVKKKEQFIKTFKQINDNFQEKFSLLSRKGTAYLQLDSSEKPFDGGLNVKVRLMGQRYLDIKSLSGGEKTMTALAFIFSIQEHQPHSFYVLDEVDAALDKHNSEKLAKLIREYCTNAQYVVISHNDSLIAEADTLYGTSMDEFGVTKVLSLKV